MYPLGASSAACFVLSRDNECRTFLGPAQFPYSIPFFNLHRILPETSKTAPQPSETNIRFPRRVALICHSKSGPASRCGLLVRFKSSLRSGARSKGIGSHHAD